MLPAMLKLSHLLLPILITALSAPDSGAAEKRKPNFIIINIDDLGYADIGPFGSTNKTPHLDRMAKEGRKLTSHYAAPVCSPSRASLMTGCYPKRVLPIPHVLFPASAVGLSGAEETVAEVLKSSGYATACIGKWHLGDQPEFLPTSQGFDSYFGIPYSNDMGTAAEGSKSNWGVPVPMPKPGIANGPESDETGLKGMSQPPLPLVENDKVVGRIRAEEQLTVTRQYTEKAVEFIRAQKDKPFLLYMPHTAVHFPLYPSDAFRGKSPNGLIGDWVQEVDWSVGQVLDTLRDLKLAENTLVIFTSDNGGSMAHGSNNQPLRGTKGQTLEGGIRVCTLAWWPSHIPAGTETGAITSMMDILPTFASLAGTAPSSGHKIDGVDITEVLLGNKETIETRNAFYYFRGLNLYAVRSGDWKLHLAIPESQPGKKKAPSPPKLQLYNLADDIGEAKNLAEEKPEVVQRLQALVQKMKDDLGLEGVGPGCRALGRAKTAEPFIHHDGTVRTNAVGAQKSFP